MKKTFFLLLGALHLLWSKVVKGKSFNKSIEDIKKELAVKKAEEKFLIQLVQLKNELDEMFNELDNLSVDCNLLHRELMIKYKWFDWYVKNQKDDLYLSERFVKSIDMILMLFDILNKRIVVMKTIQSSLKR